MSAPAAIGGTRRRGREGERGGPRLAPLAAGDPPALSAHPRLEHQPATFSADLTGSPPCPHFSPAGRSEAFRPVVGRASIRTPTSRLRSCSVGARCAAGFRPSTGRGGGAALIIGTQLTVPPGRYETLSAARGRGSNLRSHRSIGDPDFSTTREGLRHGNSARRSPAPTARRVSTEPRGPQDDEPVLHPPRTRADQRPPGPGGVRWGKCWPRVGLGPYAAFCSHTHRRQVSIVARGQRLPGPGLSCCLGRSRASPDDHRDDTPLGQRRPPAPCPAGQRHRPPDALRFSEHPHRKPANEGPPAPGTATGTPIEPVTHPLVAEPAGDRQVPPGVVSAKSTRPEVFDRGAIDVELEPAEVAAPVRSFGQVAAQLATIRGVHFLALTEAAYRA